MTYSNEVKAKVFANYYRQKFISINPNDPRRYCDFSGLYKSELTGKYILKSQFDSMEFYIENCKILLRPLSAITDEEAIEVAKIMGIENSIVFEKDAERIILEDIDPTGKQVWLWFDGDILLEDSYKEKIIFPEDNKAMVFVYQYLQSRGFDLPQWALDGKTLHEAGLAIYSQEEAI